MVQGVYFNADMLATSNRSGRSVGLAHLAVWLVVVGHRSSTCRAICAICAPACCAALVSALGWRLASGLASLVVGCLALTAYGHYAAFFRSHAKIFHQVVPANLVSAGVKAWHTTLGMQTVLEKIGTDAVRWLSRNAANSFWFWWWEKPLALKIGGLNPGAPETTPELKAMSDVINFPTFLLVTATAVSVPCMFFQARSVQRQSVHQENLWTYCSVWGCIPAGVITTVAAKECVDRVRHINIRDLAAPEQCGDEGCLDGDIAERPG